MESTGGSWIWRPRTWIWTLWRPELFQPWPGVIEPLLVGATDKDIDKDRDTDEGRDAYSTPEFDRFWSEYPKRAGKIAAFKEFQRFRLGPKIDQVLEMVRIYKAKTELKFCLDPERWIKRGHWLDDNNLGANTVDEAKLRTQRWMERTGG